MSGGSAVISHSFPLLFGLGPTSSSPVSCSFVIKPFVVEPGYSLIPEKLVTKVQLGHFVGLGLSPKNTILLGGGLFCASGSDINDGVL